MTTVVSLAERFKILASSKSPSIARSTVDFPPANEPMAETKLPKMKDADFAACHV